MGQHTRPKRQAIISRDYRGDVDRDEIDKFMPLVMDMEDEGTVTPILRAENTTFAYIKHQNLYVVAATKKNANVALVFVFLHKLVQVCYRFGLGVGVWERGGGGVVV